MAINRARFNEHGAIDATIDGVDMSVPDDMKNKHRQMIAEWVAAGNAIAPYVPPVIDLDAQDIAEINRMLLQPGSFTRGVAIQLFKVKKFLDPSYTVDQYKLDMKADMR